MTQKTETERRAAARLRTEAKKYLLEAGHKASAIQTAKGVALAVATELGADLSQDHDELVRKYVDSKRPLPKPITNLNTGKFKPLRLSSQWDLNVERARKSQPRLWTPNGVGNGAEHRHGYGRGA